jgi:hypothetical protein
MKMKKINFLFVVITALFTLNSCNIEPIDPSLSSEVDNGGNSSGGGTSSGDYWPAAINNEWHLERNGTALPVMKMVSTEVISGKTYYKFAPQSGSGSTSSGTVTISLNKDSGIYKLKTDDITISAGGLNGMQTGYEYVVLNDDLAVGGSWNGSYSQTTTYTGFPGITINTTYSGVVLEKNVSAIVDGETYPDVIKVKVTQISSLAGAPSTSAVTEYWYAKNVGIIKSITVSGGNTYASILVDYTLY